MQYGGGYGDSYLKQGYEEKVGLQRFHRRSIDDFKLNLPSVLCAVEQLDAWCHCTAVWLHVLQHRQVSSSIGCCYLLPLILCNCVADVLFISCRVGRAAAQLWGRVSNMPADDLWLENGSYCNLACDVVQAAAVWSYTHRLQQQQPGNATDSVLARVSCPISSMQCWCTA